MCCVGKTCVMCSNKDNIDVSVELTFLFGQVEQEFSIKAPRPPECRVDKSPFVAPKIHILSTYVQARQLRPAE